MNCIKTCVLQLRGLKAPLIALCKKLKQVCMLKIVLFSLISMSSLVAWSQNKVTKYTTTFIDCSRDTGDAVIVGIRQFDLDGVPKRLVVEANSLKTKIINSSELNCKVMSIDKFEKTYYAQIRAQAVMDQSKLANVGVKRFDQQKVVLTVDMCPSSKPYETQFYDWLKTTGSPVGVALTAGWGLKHQAEFNNLKQIAKQYNNITWVNHSYRHPYVKGLPDDKNFLLIAGTNIEHEVLDNEIFMIENGLTPSVFFRFPGLISNYAIVQKISDWGLIATGSDAWLAKGQIPKAGSIILIHGNGNEPAGVNLFFKYLNQILSLGLASLP